MCERFEDASVIQTVANYTKILYAHHCMERHSRAEKNLIMTRIVLLWLLSKTIVTLATISLDMCLEPFQHHAVCF